MEVKKMGTVSAPKCTKNRLTIGLRRARWGSFFRAWKRKEYGYKGKEGDGREEKKERGKKKKRKGGKGGKGSGRDSRGREVPPTVISKSRRL